MFRTCQQRIGMAIRHLTVALIAFLVLQTQTIVVGAASKEDSKSTHKQVRAIRVSDDSRSVTLQTFVLSAARELWLSCQSVGSAANEDDGTFSTSHTIQVRSGDGTLIREIKLPFAAQAINFSDKGVPYIAGSGKIARLTASGEIDKVIDAPNLLSEEEMKAKVAASNKKMLDQIMGGQDSQLKRLQEQVSKLEEDLKQESVQSDERAKKRAESRLTILKQQLESQQEMYDTLKRSYESMFSGEADTSQYKRSTGIAVSKQDVFVSLPSLEGHGYAVYRLTHDLTEAELIVDELHGCCGQLDIQTDGTHLIVAENSAFKVRYFDRDGKEAHSFGERGNSRLASTTPSLAGWGSCCNPMNVRCAANNELLVAESSIGHIKRYTHDGEFLGLVGTAKIAGGCKHVAIAHDPEQDWYYMMNTAANNVLVLVPNDQAPAETEDERESRMAMEGLGQKLLGSWRAMPKSARPVSEVSQVGEDSPESDELTITTTVVEYEVALAAEETEEDGDGRQADNENREAESEATTDADGEEASEAIEESTTSSFDYGNYILSQNRFLKFEKNGTLTRQEPRETVEAKPAESVGGFFGAVATVFLGVESNPSNVIESQPAAWIAIRQQFDLLQIGILEDEVLNYVAAVRFIDDDHAEFTWYYGEVGGAPLAQCTYQRVAQAESCNAGTCQGAQCDVPGCKHDSPSSETSNDNTGTPLKADTSEVTK